MEPLLTKQAQGLDYTKKSIKKINPKIAVCLYYLSKEQCFSTTLDRASVKIDNRNAKILIHLYGVKIYEKQKLKGDSKLWQNRDTRGAVNSDALANTFSSLSEHKSSIQIPAVLILIVASRYFLNEYIWAINQIIGKYFFLFVYMKHLLSKHNSLLPIVIK